jgi:hypothetical protein
MSVIAFGTPCGSGVAFNGYNNCSHRLSLRDRKRRLNWSEKLESMHLVAGADEIVFGP